MALASTTKRVLTETGNGPHVNCAAVQNGTQFTGMVLMLLVTQ